MGVACVHVCVCARTSRSLSVRITHPLVLQLTSSSNKGHKGSLVNIITMLTFEGSPISDQKKTWTDYACPVNSPSNARAHVRERAFQEKCSVQRNQRIQERQRMVAREALVVCVSLELAGARKLATTSQALSTTRLGQRCSWNKIEDNRLAKKKASRFVHTN